MRRLAKRGDLGLIGTGPNNTTAPGEYYGRLGIAKGNVLRGSHQYGYNWTDRTYGWQKVHYCYRYGEMVKCVIPRPTI